MNQFAVALACFVLLHIGLSATGLRGALVGRIGEGRYRILFSVASLVLLVWMIGAFASMRADATDPLNQPLWQELPAALQWLGIALALLGVTLAVAGVLTPGPTYAGFESRVNQETAARGVLRLTRHPFLWGVALWASGHLLLNGERFALMLFGALGAMVVLGARSIDRKGRARDGEAFARFEAITSSVPLAAILQGRNRFDLGEAWQRLAVGAVVAVAVMTLHAPRFLGLSTLP
jgi:uncharacterized membrane protein